MNRHDLEYKLIYSMVVAGKSQTFAEAATRRLIGDFAYGPFEFIRRTIAMRTLAGNLRRARVGNYGKLELGLRDLVRRKDLDLATCTPSDLERIHGIGPKTARFFLLWTRPGARYAALDVHVLRWMQRQGYAAPATTPSNGSVYRKLEQRFIAEADMRGVTPRELDHAIWVEAAHHRERSERTAELVKPREVADRLAAEKGGG